MKCTLCKYSNMAREAAQHSNGVTLAHTEALRLKFNHERGDGKVCDAHKDQTKRSEDIAVAHKDYARALENPQRGPDLAHIWYDAIHTPKMERIG